MKQTVNVNIGAQIFTIDQDAYGVLRSYLGDIRSRLPEGDVETIGDIESRIAEIFCDRFGVSSMRVVTIETVRDVMRRMGRPADFGEPHSSTTAAGEAQAAPADLHRLFRSRADRSIAGICGGLSEFFGLDATLLRLLTIVLVIFGGLSIWIYIILWIVIPNAPLSIGSTEK